jgi:hypothetical protein
MGSILDYLDRVSIFGPSAVALFAVLTINWSFSLLHILEEWRGEEVPLWRVFGAVVGVKIPDPLGFALFTVGLLALLLAVGLSGMTGWLPFLGQLPLPTAVGALGAILGALSADSIISHWLLYWLGYRPNPGLRSTVLYAVEFVFILIAFWKGLTLAPTPAWIGVGIGAAFFILVLPALRAFRAIPSWRREPWVRWQPIPEWARV